MYYVDRKYTTLENNTPSLVVKTISRVLGDTFSTCRWSFYQNLFYQVITGIQTSIDRRVVRTLYQWTTISLSQLK